jgi:hypothetical protein
MLLATTFFKLEPKNKKTRNPKTASAATAAASESPLQEN